MERNKSAEADWCWPGVINEVIPAVALPILAFEAIDLLNYEISRLGESAIRTYFWTSADFLRGALIIVPGFLLARKGSNGIILLAFGILCSFLTVTWFRSDNILLGTFDDYELSKLTWFAPVIAGAVVGGLAGSLIPAKGQRGGGNWLSLMATLGLFIAAILVHKHITEPLSPWSAFAPTRHILLYVLSGCFAVLIVISRMTREVQYA